MLTGGSECNRIEFFMNKKNINFEEKGSDWNNWWKQLMINLEWNN